MIPHSNLSPEKITKLKDDISEKIILKKALKKLEKEKIKILALKEKNKKSLSKSDNEVKTIKKEKKTSTTKKI